MMKYLLYFLLFSFVTSQEVLLISFPIGSYQLNFIYRNTTAPQRVIFVSQQGLSLYFITVNATQEFSTEVCRQKSQDKIIWGPRGCSDAENPLLSIDNAFCISSEAQRQQRLGIFQSTFKYSKESNQCFLEGGEGEICMCPGPIRLAIQGRDSFIPLGEITSKMLLQAQMVFYDTQAGPNGFFPSIVPIQILPPAMNVITTCPGGWNQSYTPFSRNNYPSVFTEVWETFAGTNKTDLQVLLRGSLNFKIQFGILEITYFESDEFIFSFGGTFPSFLDLIEEGVVYNFHNSTYNCTAQFYFPTPTVQIQAPFPPSPQNVSWNIFPRFYYQTRICSYMTGVLDHENQLRIPFLPEDAKMGGDPIMEDPISGLPIEVPPNPFLDYRFDCLEYCPRNNTFRNYGQNGNPDQGTYIQCLNIPLERCYFPFILPSLIQLNINPDERYIQCLKQGGKVHGKSRGECYRDITQVECKLGNHYFNGRCYHDFSPVTDQKYAVPLSEAQEACQLFSPFASSLVEVDSYLLAWLQKIFIFLQKKDTTYRVPQFGTLRCIIITPYGTFPDRSCYEVKNGTEYIFPVCSYPATELKPLHVDQGISLQGARLARYGQIGPKSGGSAATCRCFDGSTGKICEVRTCPTPTQAISPGNLTPELFFFQQCSLDNHGECYMGSPGVCVCHFGWGPAASILPSQPLLEQFSLFPCMFPSTGIFKTRQFIVNNIIYELPYPTMEIPCGGIGHGVATLALNDSYARGRCDCDQRPILRGSSIEDAFQGRACSCSKAIIPFEGIDPNGIITTGFCNSKGVCCPFGQSSQNPYLGAQYAPQCINGEKGCQCQNGWGGNSCTCPKPLDLAEGRFVTEQRPFLFVDLGQKYFVKYINISCHPYVSNKVGQNESECIFNNQIQLYECVAHNSSQFIWWEGGCLSVKAYETNFVFCGKNETINPFAGRFFQISIYRGPFKYLEPQPFLTAGFGCTNTKCFCNTLFGGRLCQGGVSSYRFESGKWSKQFCGEESLVPALYNPVQGRGQLDGECKCNSLVNVDPTGSKGLTYARFTGRACQCVEGLVNNEFLLCFGEGECEEPWTPWGWCERDLEAFLTDSLYQPFIQAASSNEQVLSLVVQEDSYFFITSNAPTIAPVPVVVTPFPTHNPVTFTPTVNPTTPTNKPTKNPTGAPTKNPTTKPTSSPTNNPTYKPTENPTKHPSKSPSKKPTTGSPTKNPTKLPSKNPTTGAPSKNPTKNPT